MKRLCSLFVATLEMVNFDGTVVGAPSEVTLDPDESTSIVATVSSDLRTIVSVPAE